MNVSVQNMIEMHEVLSLNVFDMLFVRGVIFLLAVKY